MARRESRERRARIIHIAQSTAGGIASYLEEVAAYQSGKFGPGNIAFVVPDATRHLPHINPDQLIGFDSAARTPAALLQFAKTAYTAVRRLRPEIVHLHSSFAGAILRPMLALTRHRPRVIYCPHGWAFAMETSAAKQRAYASIERQLAAITDVLHVNSQSEYEAAVRFGLPAEKMRVLRNGIGWAPPRRRERSNGRVRVAFIGRHDRQKGLDVLLDTIERFPLDHIHFDIVGDGILTKGVRPTADRQNVRFHGWLTRAQTLHVLETADAVVMPSRWDAAPIVATEAMRAGVPVIGSNRGAIPEIVGHGVGGYIFDLDDPDALGRVLRSLDRDELRPLGAGAWARWERLYQSDTMNQLTCQVYQELLGKTRPEAAIEATSDLSTPKRSYGA